MTIETLGILILFAVALSAFVTAINSRGTVRVILSYVLAGAILIAAVFSVAKVQAGKELARQQAERIKYEEQLKKAEEEARLAAEQAAQAAEAAAVPVGDTLVKGEMAKIANEGSVVARNIIGLDLDKVAPDFDGLDKARSFSGQAADLRKRFDAIAKTGDDPSTAAAREQIEKGLRTLAASANYFGLYFKAEDEKQEDERWEVYQNNAKAAKAAFGAGLEKLGTK